MTPRLTLTIVFTLLIAAACAPAAPVEPTVDTNEIYTAAAKTVVAEFTLTAAVVPPTAEATSTNVPASPTSLLQLTITPGTPGAEASGTAVLCDHLTFDVATVDVNIPDNTEMTPGQDFVKTWRVKNDGGCAWGAGYGLVYAGYSNRMSGQPVPLSTVISVGQEVELSVNFKAPTDPGEYVSAWQMANDKGLAFPKPIYVKIVVR